MVPLVKSIAHGSEGPTSVISQGSAVCFISRTARSFFVPLAISVLGIRAWSVMMALRLYFMVQPKMA